MPPLPNVPNVIKVQVKGLFTSGFPWANVLHFLYSGPPASGGDLGTFAQSIYTSYNAHLVPIMATSQSLEEVVCSDLSSSTGSENNYILHTAGTSSGSEIPGNACFLVSKYVNVRYRGGHPRSYLAVGTQVNLQNQAEWNSAFVTTVTNAFKSIIFENTATTFGSLTIDQEVAVSYYTTDYTVTPHKRIRKTVPDIYGIPFDGYTGNGEIASQRRRIGRRR